MLIRSQTKTELVPLEKVVVTLNGLDLGNIVCFDLANDDPDNYLTLGVYNSPEKAIEILDEIENAFSDGKAVFQMPQDSDVRTRKEFLLEKLEQRAKTMITTRILDSKVGTEKFVLWEEVKSAVEEVMGDE